MLRRALLLAATIAVTIGLAVGLAACGSSGSSDAKQAVLLDVRTSAEYAAGHLDGATLMDVTAADFQARVDALAKDGRYEVYCHSGRRAAQAASIMQAAGLQVTNLGGIADAAKTTGRPIVRG